jgi:WD40 repeat protein
LQNVPATERAACKLRLAERLQAEEGLAEALCNDTLDLLEATICGEVSARAEIPEPSAVQSAPAILLNDSNRNGQGSGLPGMGKFKKLLTLEGVGSVAISPDGRRVAFKNKSVNTIEIWDVENCRLLKTWNNKPFDPCGFNPDGRKIVARDREGRNREFHIRDVENGEILRTFFAGKYLGFSPDGQKIIFSTFSSSGIMGDYTTFEILDVKRGKKKISFREQEFDYRLNMKYSPDGCRIAVVNDSGKITIRDAKKGQEIYTVELSKGRGGYVEYSPDGKQIITYNWGIPIQRWDAENGTLLQTLPDSGHFLTYRPDGLQIAYSIDGKIKTWSGKNGKTLVVRNKPYVYFSSLAYSPDGRYIAINDSSATVEIRDAESGQKIQTFHSPGTANRLKYSSDGQRIITYSEHIIAIWGVE